MNIIRFILLVGIFFIGQVLFAQNWPEADGQATFSDQQSGSGESSRSGTFPIFYSNRVAFVPPNQNTGPSIGFPNLPTRRYAQGSGCLFNSPTEREINPTYLHNGNIYRSAFSFVPRRQDAGGDATITMRAEFRIQFNCGGSYHDRVHNYYDFTIAVEAPEILNSFDNYSEICLDANNINLYDHFTPGITGVTFNVVRVSTGAVVQTNITTLDPSSLAPGDYTLRASKTYDNGTYTQQKPFTIIAKPSTTITKSISGNSFCAGESVTLSAAEAPAGQTYTYQWIRNSPFTGTSTVGTNREIEAAETGTYHVVISVAGCSETSEQITLTRMEAPVPNITFQSGSNNICEGTTAILSANATDAESWQWIDLQNNEVIGESQILNVTSTTTVKVIVTYTNGCSRESQPMTVNVRPNPQPTIGITGETTFCEGGEVVLRATLPEGFIATNYQWSNGQSGQTITVNQSGTYSVRTTNQQGCISESEPVTVTVHPNLKPTITPNGPTTFCEGGQVVLSAPTAASYLWNNGATTQSITVTQSGAFSVRTTTNDGCHNESDMLSVTVRPNVKPTIQAQGNTEICEGESVVLQVTNSQPNTTYTWSNGQTGLQATFTTSQNAYVIATTQGSNGCSQNSDPVAITVNPIQKPEIITSGNTTFCEGGEVTLTVSNPGGADEIRWSNGETGTSITVTTSGNYYATIVKDDCERMSDEVAVTVTPNVMPIIQAQGPTIFCQGESVTLQVTNPQQNTTYTWNDGTTGLTKVVSGSGNYFVTASNSSNCSRTAEPIRVTVNPIQKPEIITSNNTTFCEGGEVTLTVSNPGGADEIRWSNGETGTSITVTTSGNYYATIVIGDCERMSDEVTVTVTPNVMPIIQAQGPTTLCEGNTLVLQVTNPQQNTTYMWNDGTTGLIKEVTNSGNYFVTASNASDCSRTSEPIRVTVNPIQKPEIITSNNTTFCEGGEVTLTVSNPGGADEIRWSNGETGNSITVTTSGNYYATIVIDDCERMSDQVTVTVTPNVTPTIEAQSPTVFCEGQSVTLQVTNPQQNTTYTWNDGTTGTTKVATTSGNYFVMAVNADNCSKTSQPIQVTVQPIPKPTISLDNESTICDGDEVTLTINEFGASYRWNNGATTKSITVENTGTYIAYITNDEGCERASDPIHITVQPNATVAMSQMGETTFCEGDSLVLTVLNSGTYLWNNGETSRSITIKNSGIYFVTVTNDFDCQNTSIPVEVTVHPIPKPTISPSGSTTICSTDEVTLTIDQEAVGYRWSNGATTKSITVSTAGSYTAYITNDQGCERESEPIQVTVNQNPKPIVRITGETEFCQPDSVTLSVTPIVGHTYQWNTGEIGNSITVYNSGTYYVTSTTPDDCINISDPVEVTVHPLPKPTISPSGSTTICSTDEVTLTIDQEAVGYRWSNGATTKSITVSTAGSYTAHITNDQGCERASEPILIIVNQNPKPVIRITGETEFCQPDSVILSVTPIAGHTYQWNTGDVGNSITVYNSGTYYVTSTTPDDCINISDPVEVTVHPLPKPTISPSGSTTICSTDEVTLTIDQEAVGYRWSNGATTKSITVSTAGSYTAYITNDQGCERASEPILIIVNQNPKPVIRITGEIEFCEPDSVILSVTPVVGHTYQWNTGETGTSITVHRTGAYYVTSTTPEDCINISEPVEVLVHPLPKPTINTIGEPTFCEGDSVVLTINEIAASYRWSNGATTKSITVNNSGTYIAYITNDEGCERATDPLQVTVLPNPPATITYSSLVACDGDSVRLEANLGVSYLWSNGETERVIYVKDPGEYYVMVTNTYGCESRSENVLVEILPNDVPTITSTRGAEFCTGESTTLTASEGKLYRWSTGETTRSITVSSSGTYTVTVVNDNDCSRQSLPFEVTVRNPTPLQPILNVNLCENDGIFNLDEHNPNDLVGTYHGTAVSNNQFNPQVAGIGNHEIEFVYTNEFGCVSSQTFNISITALEPINHLPDMVVCINDPIIPLMVNDMDATTVITGEGITGSLFNPFSAGIGRHSITYEMTNANGCVTISYQVIEVLPAPTQPEVVGNMEVCRGTVITLRATSTILGDYAIIYQWYKRGEDEPFAQGREIRYTVQQNEVIYVTASTEASCSSVRTEIDIVSTTPDGFITVSKTELLQGDVVDFFFNDDPQSQDAVRFEWNFGDGNISYDRNPSHYYNVPGEHTVEVVFYSETGCRNTAEYAFIQVHEDPLDDDDTIDSVDPLEDNRPFTNNIVYPNPIEHNMATLRYNNEGQSFRGSVQVFGINGALILSQDADIASGVNEISIDNLHRLTAQTIYLVALVRENGDRVEVFKVLKL